MTRGQDRDAEREARRLAAAAAVEERVRLAVESAPPLPPDVERHIRQLILAHGATIDTATARAMVDPSRLAEFDRLVAEAERKSHHA